MNARPRVLVIGAGSIGERHVRCFQATGRVEVAVCEPNQTVRDAVQSKYGIAQSFESLETALAAPFDLAVVGTPAQFHVAQARTLVERGIHALVEKPLSLEIGGIEELVAAAATHGRFCIGCGLSSFWKDSQKMIAALTAMDSTMKMPAMSSALP